MNKNQKPMVNNVLKYGIALSALFTALLLISLYLLAPLPTFKCSEYVNITKRAWVSDDCKENPIKYLKRENPACDVYIDDEKYGLFNSPYIYHVKCGRYVPTAYSQENMDIHCQEKYWSEGSLYYQEEVCAEKSLMRVY